MEIGTCKLCLAEGVALQESHMMPAALYGKPRREFEVLTASGTLKTILQLKQPMLCGECEQRFNKGGEDHVLKVIAPKSRKSFPLHDLMKASPARESDPSISRFYGPDFELDMDKFAYFAVSVVWRAVAVRWLMQDGTFTKEVNLGAFQESMRRYLIGETPLPSDMAAIVIVCSDAESRMHFTLPSDDVEAGCINLRFLARGVFFRVLIGHQMWSYLREQSCTSSLKSVFYGDCKQRTLESLEGIRPSAPTAAT